MAVPKLILLRAIARNTANWRGGLSRTGSRRRSLAIGSARAFAWIYPNIKKHGGDRDRLFICGQSAGGHLAALLALNRTYLDEVRVPRSAVRGVIPISRVHTVSTIGFGGRHKQLEEASPTTHVKNFGFPMLVVTEDGDAVFQTLKNMFKAAVELERIRDVEFYDAKNRNHIPIVTSTALQKDDPVRLKISEWIKAKSR